MSKESSEERKPRMPIRRFDVFAEYNRLEALEKGMSEEEAAGHGIWIAKVVASGGGRGAGPKRPGGTKAEEDENQEKAMEDDKPKAPRFRTLNGEPQTDKLFEEEIVRRMGREFYNTVFSPAIEDAYKQDRGYTAIRDTIRKDWKP